MVRVFALSSDSGRVEFLLKLKLQPVNFYVAALVDFPAIWAELQLIM